MSKARGLRSRFGHPRPPVSELFYLASQNSGM